MLSKLHDVVRGRGGGRLDAIKPCDPCARSIDEAVRHVIDATPSRMRAIPGYARRLRGPLAHALSYIDEVAGGLPPAIPWSRGAFSCDARFSAFFVDSVDAPRLFSDDGKVRHWFAVNLDSATCVAALTMLRVERRQLGIAVLGDQLQREVLQTGVSFRDHRLLSPGGDEESARSALKCWMLDSLIEDATACAVRTRLRRIGLESRARGLRARLRRLPLHHRATGAEGAELEREIDQLERQMETLSVTPPHEQHAFLIDLLSRPERFLKSRREKVFLDRAGIKYLEGVTHSAFEIWLYEIQVGQRHPRTVSLVRFPRTELLPERDLVSEASLFLSGGGRLQ